MILETLGLSPAPRRPHGTLFLEYYGAYLNDIESGLILNRGKKYSDSFISISRVDSRMLPSLKIAKLQVDNITEEQLRELAAELTAMGYAKNTVATYMDPIMSFITGGAARAATRGRIWRAAASGCHVKMSITVYT